MIVGYGTGGCFWKPRTLRGGVNQCSIGMETFNLINTTTYQPVNIKAYNNKQQCNHKYEHNSTIDLYVENLKEENPRWDWRPTISIY